MASRWVDPTGKVGAAEATTDLAQRAATAEARRRSRVDARWLEPDLQVLLWRSLERAGWHIEEVDA